MAIQPNHTATPLEKVLSLYANESWATRFHVATRCKRIPFDELKKLMPQSGRLADLGCGHGVFSNLLAMASPKREVVDIDKDRKKIEIAKKTIGERLNITFQVQDLSQLRLDPFSGIAILGVLYLLPFDRHRPVLEQCLKSLVPGGILLLNTVDPSSRIRFWKSKLLEFTINMAFRLLGVQSTSVSFRLYPRRKDEWVKMLRDIGYSMQTANISLPTPGNIFLCRKDAGSA